MQHLLCPCLAQEPGAPTNREFQQMLRGLTAHHTDEITPAQRQVSRALCCGQDAGEITFFCQMFTVVFAQFDGSGSGHLGRTELLRLLKAIDHPPAGTIPVP
jgi:hypothetical protein